MKKVKFKKRKKQTSVVAAVNSGVKISSATKKKGFKVN